ncbi:MAG: efflux RND transporter periplasmic adaptor subunit [Halothiobacillaceae bacterium]
MPALPKDLLRHVLRRALPAFVLALCLPAAVLAETVDGVVTWSERLVLSVPVSGVVAEVNVRPGQTVEAGRVLLRLDATPFDARLAEARALQQGLTRQAEEAALDAERAQALYDRTVASDSELQAALIASEQARAELEQARAQRTLAAWSRERSVLSAPYEARVLAVHVTPGQTVVSALDAPRMIELAPAGELGVQVDVTPAAAAGLKLGQTLSVQMGDVTATGEIAGITAVDDESGIRYRLALRVSDVPGDVLPGMPARVTLTD